MKTDDAQLETIARNPEASYVPWLVREVRRLRRALSFYAERDTYRVHPLPRVPIAIDRGRIARHILDNPITDEDAELLDDDEKTPPVA